MSFQLKGRTCEKCDSLTWTDTTGEYEATLNPTGYGGPSAPASYTSFTSYTLSVFKPGTDTSGTPDYVLDLLTAVPVIDDDGNPVWTITADTLEEDEPMTSGVWYFRALGVYNDLNYYASCRTLFTLDLHEKIDDIMKAQPVPAPLDKLILDPELDAAKGSACCGQTDHAQAIVDWLYTQINSMCC